MYLTRWILIFNLTLSASIASGAGTAESVAKQDEDFTLRETDYLDCVYPRLISPQTPGWEIQSHFQPPLPSACPEIVRRFQELLRSGAAEPASLRFPLYSSIWKAARSSRQTDLSEFKVYGPVFAAPGRNFLSSISLDTGDVENSLRRQLKVKTDGTFSGALPVGHCDRRASELPTEEALKRRYDQSFWHEMLLLHGYDCMALLYGEVAAKMNADAGHSNIQDTFQGLVHNWTPREEAELESKIQNQAFVLVPQLGYDFPSGPFGGGTEKLDTGYMKEAFTKLGARFYVVNRTSVDEMDRQVETSLKNLDEILREEARIQRKKSPHVYFLARSMGGMVLRLMLERRPELQAQANGALLLGSTPWGSVIAEFKSRMDKFDEVYVGLSNPISIVVSGIAGAFDKSLSALTQSGGQRLNIRSMSHRNYQPKAATDLNVPVFNVVLLPPSIRDYYNGSSLIAGGDPTFLIMSMYGPTEGSSPLAHASLDTAHSLRVIDGRLNHLSFWELEKPKAMELWWASLLTAMRSGIFNAAKR